MSKRNFGNYQVELDMDATENWYATSEGWGCECGHCRNFLKLAKKKNFPYALQKFQMNLVFLLKKRPMYVNYIRMMQAVIINSVIELPAQSLMCLVKKRPKTGMKDDAVKSHIRMEHRISLNRTLIWSSTQHCLGIQKKCESVNWCYKYQSIPDLPK